MNGTLNVITQSKRKFGLGVILPSTRHIQCQVTFRSKIKSSSNANIRNIHASTTSTNVQYDQFNTTREALKQVRLNDESYLIEKLTTQSLVIKSIWSFVDSKSINCWTSVINHLPRNIFSFTIRYLNNTLANGTNAIKWGITNNSSCILCREDQTLGHVIGGCNVALEEKRYNWRHDSILLNIYKIVNSNGLKVFLDIDGYESPSIVTGENYRPDLLIVKNNMLLVLELTVGFETNIKKNFDRKAERYNQLLSDLSSKYQVHYVNLSLGAIGVVGNGNLLVNNLTRFGLNIETTNFLVKRIINVCIRTTYFIFCMRNKGWENPDLMSW